MKYRRSTPYRLAFSACLIMGILAGALMAGIKGRLDRIPDRPRLALSQPASQPASIPAPRAQLTTGEPGDPTVVPGPTATTVPLQSIDSQQNLLVIGVDHLDAHEARLESIWLVLYFPPEPQFSLLPLYPASAKTDPEPNHLLETAFRLEPDLSPAPGLLIALHSMELWWNNYAVLDRAGLAGVIELASGANFQDGASDGLRVVSSLTPAWEDPHASLLSQTALLRALCKKTAQLPATADLVTAMGLISEHMHTDLRVEEVIAAAQKWLAPGKGFSCEFPTLHKAESTAPYP